ncbi:MAG: hypothetical protein HFK09_06260 [Clostridia bacterium]|nr:hypothetical protein [Clostridia bacterium]
MKILVINSGSYSIKSKVVDFESDSHIAVSVNGIGSESAYIKIESSFQNRQIPLSVSDYKKGMDLLLDAYSAALPEYGLSLDDMDAVAVRVVCVSDVSFTVAEATNELLNRLSEKAYLSPLHQNIACEIMKTCMAVFQGKVYAVSDSMFYNDMPSSCSLYAVDRTDASKFKIKKNGFHGFSHHYMYVAAARLLQKTEPKVITCHLGGGSSISAVRNGRCIDTSMGFSPTSGLPMSTRCGDIDAVAVLELMRCKNWTVEQTIAYLNTQCGFKGISGTSGDFKEIKEEVKKGNESAILALRHFTCNIKKHIGSYYALLNGVDCLVFAGAIANHNSDLIRKICNEMDVLGIDIMPRGEKVCDDIQVLTSESSRVKVYLLKTDEEAIIAETVKSYMENDTIGM